MALGVFLLLPGISSGQSFQPRFAIDPNSAAVLYAAREGSILSSEDSGSTWAVFASNLPEFHTLLAIGSPTVLYATSDSGVFRSREGGHSWISLNSGLSELSARLLAASPNNPRLVHVTTSSGLFNSSDEGVTWTRAAGLPAIGPSSIASDPANALVLYAGVANSLFRSTDGGATWLDTGSSFPSGNGGEEIVVIAFDPNRPSTLAVVHKVVTVGPREFSTSYDLYLSSNSGGTFAHVAVPGGSFVFAALFDASSTLYAVNGATVLTSPDHGASWFPSLNLPNAAGVIAASWTSPRVLIAEGQLNGSPIFISDNHGASWNRITLTPCLGLRETLCLADGRFLLRLEPVVGGVTRTAHAVPLTRDAGAFWIFSDNNIELVVKIVDGRAVNNHYWLFVASLTDVPFTLDLTDVLAGVGFGYTQQAGRMRSFADVQAFSDPP